MSIVDLINSKLNLSQSRSTYPLPGKIVDCLMPGCGKPFLMRHWVGSPDQICPECAKVYADSARIICRNCNVTICRVVPKVLDNGFYIRPRMVLHSDCCNMCRDNIAISTIIEIAEFEKRTRPKKIIIAR